MNPLLRTTEDLQCIPRMAYPAMAFEAGGFYFFQGPSGSGKSTYFKLLNGMLKPIFGEVFYQEKPLSFYDILDYRKEVLLVPQEVFLWEGSIADNFAQYYSHRNETTPSTEIMEEFLALCHAPFTPDTPCQILSGGERQRVFLALFTSMAKKVLLLDEPTAALDTVLARHVLQSLKAYGKDHDLTILTISHHESLVQELGDRVITIGGASHA